ncbi:MAG: DegT/DnrJ/EryC1/StrS family aminotransferase, partial [Bacteroidia bacterium]
IKLRHLDEYAAARNLAAAFYDKAFSNNPNIKTPVRQKNSTHVFHQYTLLLNGIDRNALREHLSAKGIPSMIYYPIPLHLQKAYNDPRYKKGDFPVTEKLSSSVISLPMHTELSNDDLKFITDNVIEFVKQPQTSNHSTFVNS